ncbi:MAG: thiamine pyrophosphate-dependent dehydrogenase E1 component subunit alpha [Myxococcales bacterium]|nr:thiamine pyrophosphate-dependent dehydrogenase E1 component subunit alpha [Myxococcales bacterium]MCB9629045.1 thiamine pyrophosphate-dependent dehydrogenase E1 component subunit alpha [Sandaracinaceae bacterium]
MPRARHLAAVPANERATDERERSWQRRRSPSSQSGEHPSPAPRALKLKLYRAMLLSRRLDERLMALQRQGRIGFHVGHRGEEAAIVGAAAALREQDWLVPCYREFGALLMRGAPLATYLDQMFGNEADTGHGRQMPDHFHSRAQRCLSVSAPIGTQLPHAVGLAYAARLKGNDDVALVFFGDGATSSNDFHAALNFAGVFRAPVVFACRNNGYAISLPSSRQTASDGFACKAAAYGIRGVTVDGNDVLAVHRATRAAIEAAAAGAGPTLLELVTYRLDAHSSSDDPRAYRTDAEVAEATTREPIARFQRELLASGELDAAADEALRAEVAAEVSAALDAAQARSKPALDTLFEDVYAETPWHLRDAARDAREGSAD